MSPHKLPVKLGYAVYAVFGLFVWKIFSITYMFGFDFRIYYQAAQIALRGGSPYFSEVVGTGYLYPPAFALLVAPLTLLPPLAAAALWMLAGIGLLYAAWRLLADRIALPPAYKFFLFAMLTVSAGVAESLWMGQVNALAVFLLTAAFVYADSHPRRAGLALAAAVICKTSPLIFIVYFAASRRWRMTVWALAGLALLSLAGIAAFGWPTFTDFLRMGGQLTGAPVLSVQNLALAALLERAGLAYGLAVWVQRGLAAVLVLSALYFAARRNTAPMLSFAAMLTGMVLASPLLWGHHVVLALSAFVIAAQYRWAWIVAALAVMQADVIAGSLLHLPNGLLFTLGWLILSAALLSALWFDGKTAAALR